MKNTSKILIMIALFSIIICSLVTTTFAQPSPPVDTSEDGGWNTHDIQVSNELNDFTFNIEGYYKFDTKTGQFNVRVYQNEINKYLHYLALNSYEFVSFKSWDFVQEGEYWTREYRVINNASLIIEYKAQSYSVKFVDSITGYTISDNKISAGGAIIAPTPSNYLDTKGLIFVKWSTNDYSNVTQDITVYTIYAPARYITLQMPDGTEERIAVAVDTKLQDIEMPIYKNKKLKYVREPQTNTRVDMGTVIKYDANYIAVYKGFIFPNWLKTTLIVLGSVGSAVIIVCIPLIIIKRKDKKGVY